MPIIYNDALNSMRLRRGGLGAINTQVTNATVLGESYERRAIASKPATRYLLGAMQEIAPEKTKRLLSDCETISSHLDTGDIRCRLQGSLATNTHIHASDIDLVAFTTCWTEQHSLSLLSNSTAPSIAQAIVERKLKVSNTLRSRYPLATIKGGKKAVELHASSLSCKADIVPAVRFFDPGETEPGIYIYDTAANAVLANKPWKFISAIQSRSQQTNGRSVELTRLLKTLAEDCSGEINLSSYAISGIVWHITAEHYPIGNEIRAARWLRDRLQSVIKSFNTPFVTNALTWRTPDGLNAIFPSQQERDALVRLHDECARLLRAVASEARAGMYYGSLSPDDSILDAINI